MKLQLSKVLAILVSATMIFGCQTANPNWEQEASNPEFIHRSLKQITDVIVHDIFSPPVASRIYAYSTIAAYEALVPGYEDYQSLAGQLRDLTPAPQPEAGQTYCYTLAGAHAMLKVGKAMIFSEDKITDFENGILAEYKAIKIPQDVYDRSIAYGDAVADHILAWADKDNYKQTRTFPKYTITDDPARWKPTPPDYMDAIEPHWDKIRPFVIDSSNQFMPPPPTPFSSEKGSQFMKETMEVYNIINGVKDDTERADRVAVAKFWDCNPYISHHKGHVMFATKKITPGGHWMGISQIASRKAKLNSMQSAEVYAMTAVALADAFISCWDEKFRSELVRPETVINTYVDPDWTPTLQTPPFPEYTSGHSVISASAATTLTSILGDSFSYTDSVEVEFGLPPRSFNSFMEASKEAAVSRLYGGIHYWPACSVGVDEGIKVGEWVVGHVKPKKG